MEEREADLERSSGEQESVGGVVVLVEDLGQLAVVVLHPVTLVYDHVLPTNLQTLFHSRTVHD